MHQEKRAHNPSDRRRRPTAAISPYLFLGKRRGPRRSSDPQLNYYADLPARGALLTVALILVLCIIDAILSLRLFAQGKSEELNPLLVLTLNYGNLPFFGFKLVLTSVSLLVVLLHWNFLFLGRLSTVLAAYWLVGTYLAVVIYETGLLWW